MIAKPTTTADAHVEPVDVDTVLSVLRDRNGATVAEVRQATWMSEAHVLAVLGDMERQDRAVERGGKWFAC